MAPRWSIKYYEYEGGGTPFEDFIPRLARDQRAECHAIIGLLEKRGDTLVGEQCLTHACKTGEFKEYQGALVRVFYVCEPDYILIVDCLLPDENGRLFEAIRKKVEEYVKSKA